MENSKGFLWIKYSEKLAELESKLAGKGAISAETSSVKKSEAASDNPPAEAGGFLNDRGLLRRMQAHSSPGKSRGFSWRSNIYSHIESKIENLIAENKKLMEETKFLKLENDGKIYLKKELNRLQNELNELSMKKESEISRLYVENRRLEAEAGSLRFVLQRKSREALAKADEGHRALNVKREKTGILEWLSKPLIVVKTE